MTFTVPVFTILATAELCDAEMCYTEFHTYLSRSMGIRVQIFVRPDVNYDCHWSIFMYANPRLLNRKYFYTEFHENPTVSTLVLGHRRTDSVNCLQIPWDALHCGMKNLGDALVFKFGRYVLLQLWLFWLLHGVGYVFDISKELTALISRVTEFDT